MDELKQFDHQLLIVNNEFKVLLYRLNTVGLKEITVRSSYNIAGVEYKTVLGPETCYFFDTWLHPKSDQKFMFEDCNTANLIFIVK